VEHQLKEEGFDVQCTGRDDLLLIATTRKEDIETIKDEVIRRYMLHHGSVQVRYFSEYPVSESGKIAYKKIMESFDDA